ncbi:MAG: trehalose-phosphatase [Elusimicrobia bacterium]|nr:trehalose-phosphatase [Elusimicrobiota bacterium]
MMGKNWKALKSIFEIEISRGTNFLLGLDFDGTLAPLRRRHDFSALPPRMRNLLGRLSLKRSLTIVIVSGRRLEDLKRRVRIPRIYYIGNHGMEILGPQGLWIHSRAPVWKHTLKSLVFPFHEVLKHFSGAYLENKGIAFSFHYRGLSRELSPYLLRRRLADVLRPHRKLFRILSGKKVWEIRSREPWNKGKALLKLAGQIHGSRKIILVGDDISDEEGFRSLGNRGVTVRVGPMERTSARFEFKSIKEVETFLMFLDRLCH